MGGNHLILTIISESAGAAMRHAVLSELPMPSCVFCINGRSRDVVSKILSPCRY